MVPLLSDLHELDFLIENSEIMFEQGKYQDALENLREAKRLKITPALKLLEKKIREKLD